MPPTKSSLWSQTSTWSSYYRFVVYISSIGFWCINSDSSLFTFHSGKETIYLLVYADEIILTAYDPSLITRFISHLSAEFFIMYLRPLSLFPRISATQSPHWVFLSQSYFSKYVLSHVAMSTCNPYTTFKNSKPKLSTSCNHVSYPAF